VLKKSEASVSQLDHDDAAFGDCGIARPGQANQEAHEVLENG
jgi:hypothetical protein